MRLLSKIGALLVAAFLSGSVFGTSYHSFDIDELLRRALTKKMDADTEESVYQALEDYAAKHSSTPYYGRGVYCHASQWTVAVDFMDEYMIVDFVGVSKVDEALASEYARELCEDYREEVKGAGTCYGSLEPSDKAQIGIPLNIGNCNEAGILWTNPSSLDNLIFSPLTVDEDWYIRNIRPH